ncbi:MAG TPA: nuclease [Acidobacteriaceae bacterium]
MSRLINRAAATFAFLAVLSTTPAWGWGRDGHMMINYLGAKYLPHDVPAFLRNGNALDIMNGLGPQPDRLLHRDSEPELYDEQSPDHYLNMESAEMAEVPCTIGTPDCGADGKMYPKRRYDFIRGLAAAQAQHPDLRLTPQEVGMQPWEVEETWQKLKVDFRQYRQLLAANDDLAPIETVILYNAARLGHFVADGSQPLHTTIQYNGWTGPNPNGYTTEHHIHSQFESVYVSANIKRDDVAPLVAASQPTGIDDEWRQYMDYLNHSNSLVERVYQLDKAGGFTGAGTPEAKAFTDQQLAAGAIELRDLIYSAWVHSADPVQQYHGPQ